jgi:hypothetical protein
MLTMCVDSRRIILFYVYSEPTFSHGEFEHLANTNINIGMESFCCCLLSLALVEVFRRVSCNIIVSAPGTLLGLVQFQVRFF